VDNNGRDKKKGNEVVEAKTKQQRRKMRFVGYSCEAIEDVSVNLDTCPCPMLRLRKSINRK